MTDRHQDQAGSISAFVAVVALALVMVAGMAYDGGQIIAAQATARDLAASAARAGAQQVDVEHLRASGEAVLDADRAAAAAEDFLAQTGHRGSARVDGSAITVSVQLVQPMRILPVSDRTITAADTATALSGEDEPLR